MILYTRIAVRIINKLYTELIMQLKSVYASRQEVYSQQGSGNKKSTAGSIKAPALLFYKPSVK